MEEGMNLKLQRDIGRIKTAMFEVGFYFNGLPKTKDEKKKDLFGKGLALMANHDDAGALECFKKCLGLQVTGSEKSALLLVIGNCFCTDLRSRWFRPRWKEAHKMWEEALTCAEHAADERAQAAVFNNLGLACDTLQERDKALEFFEKSLKIKERIGDERGMAQTYSNLGDFHAFEQYKAIKFYRRALRIFKKTGDQAAIARTLTSLGRMHEVLDELDRTIHYYSSAIRIMEKIADSRGTARTCQELGWIFRGQKKWDNAAACWKKALHELQAIGDEIGALNAKLKLSFVYREQGKTEEASKLFKEWFRDMHRDRQSD